MSPDRHPHADLVAHLTRTTSLTPGEAARVIADVLTYFGESVEAFVRRRHRELRARGMANEQIFERIVSELAQRRVAPPELSLRQVRRIIYG